MSRKSWKETPVPLRVKVDSSHIKAMGFDVEHGILRVKFSDGEIYRYKGVRPSTVNKILDAKSVGKEFHRLVVEKVPSRDFAKE